MSCPMLARCKAVSGIDCKGRKYLACDYLHNIVLERLEGRLKILKKLSPYDKKYLAIVSKQEFVYLLNFYSEIIYERRKTLQRNNREVIKI